MRTVDIDQIYRLGRSSEDREINSLCVALFFMKLSIKNIFNLTSNTETFISILGSFLNWPAIDNPTWTSSYEYKPNQIWIANDMPLHQIQWKGPVHPASSLRVLRLQLLCRMISAYECNMYMRFVSSHMFPTCLIPACCILDIAWTHTGETGILGMF